MLPAGIGILMQSSGFVHPNDVSNVMLAWHRASVGVYSDAGVTAAMDGVGVQEWHDQSGNSRDVLQSDATKKPLLQTNEIGSMPIVDFDGVNDTLKTATTWSEAIPITVFTVLKFHGGISATNAIYDLGDGSIFQMQRLSNERLRLHNGATGVVATSVITSGVALVAAVHDSVSGEIWINGTQEDTGGSGSNVFEEIVLGTHRNGTSNPFAGGIGDFLVYRGVLSAGDFGGVMAWLNAEYGGIY